MTWVYEGPLSVDLRCSRCGGTHRWNRGESTLPKTESGQWFPPDTLFYLSYSGPGVVNHRWRHWCTSLTGPIVMRDLPHAETVVQW